MKRLISLAIVFVMVISLFSMSAVVSAVDGIDMLFDSALGTLDHYYVKADGDDDYTGFIVDDLARKIYDCLGRGALEAYIGGEDYEAVIDHYYSLDDTLKEQVLAFHGEDNYDDVKNIYTIPNPEMRNEILPEREYLGYVDNGDGTYDVYYRNITYGRLTDVIDDVFEYLKKLDFPFVVEYEGNVYESSCDGYVYVKSLDDFGIKYTVELTSEAFDVDVNGICDCEYLSDVLPAGVNEKDYIASFQDPQFVRYDNKLYHNIYGDGYVATMPEGEYSKRQRKFACEENDVRIVGYCEYTSEDLPESFDNFDSSLIFTDVKPKSWFKSSVDFVVSTGLMNGMTKEKFEPNTTMSRAMLVTVLWRLSGSPKIPYYEAPFTDLKQSWYKDAVNWAYYTGIVLGTSDTKFSPNGNITREQMATIMYRYSMYINAPYWEQTDISGYPDSGKVSDYALEPMSWAVGNGFITGTTNNVGETILAPRASATRAQVATILTRYCNGRTYVLRKCGCRIKKNNQ